MKDQPRNTAGPFEIAFGEIDEIFSPRRRQMSASRMPAYVRLYARYPRFPKDGADLAAFAERVIAAFQPSCIIVQTHNRLPGLPMNLTPPPSWDVLHSGPDDLIVRIVPAEIRRLAEFFDACEMRTYWLLSFLPAGSEDEFPSLANEDTVPASRPPAGGLSLFVDTDDCNTWALMRENDPGTMALLSSLKDDLTSR